MMFRGRKDVYARRGTKGGYYPQCANRWSENCPKQKGKQNCSDCPFQKWRPLSLRVIKNHLLGEREDGADAIGLYPLLEDGTCRFLVFDFDDHERGSEVNDYANPDDLWKKEVRSLQSICHEEHIPLLTERSRSGKGAHIWIFFKESVPAYLARQFGELLLGKGAESVHLTSFHFYDRMYPSQDSSDRLGNLIALPLQGRALQKGNTAFVDEHGNAYLDQMKALLETKRLTREEIERKIQNWTYELTGKTVLVGMMPLNDRPMPWRREQSFHKEDVEETLHIVLADGIYVDVLNTKPRLANQIRSLAAFDNPQYYRNLHSGRSNYNTFRSIYLGRDIDGYVQIPRGLFERLSDKCKEASIPLEVRDERAPGRPLKVQFCGTLREKQEIAGEKLLQYENGILEAATAFGKTVVCSYLIAERKVSTLILLDKTDLIPQWIRELERFLLFDEPLPVYQTKTGRKKTRISLIGTFHAGSDKTTGIVDIAMIGSLQSEELPEKFQSIRHGHHG